MSHHCFSLPTIAHKFSLGTFDTFVTVICYIISSTPDLSCGILTLISRPQLYLPLQKHHFTHLILTGGDSVIMVCHFETYSKSKLMLHGPLFRLTFKFLSGLGLDENFEPTKLLATDQRFCVLVRLYIRCLGGQDTTYFI